MSHAALSDDQLAVEIAEKAGKLLLEIQQSGLDGKELGKAGDEKANALIIEMLKLHRPEDAILSEEEKDNLDRLKAHRVWIVDPLDGTREYGEKRTDWAVHIALSINKQPTLGAVALPGLGLVLSTGNPPKVPAGNTPPKLLVSRTRPAADAVSVAEKLGAELLPMGSAGAKAMAVVRGEAEIYLHSGGQHQWDNCAPVAVALAAGLHASRIDGSPIVYNQASTSIPDLLICRKEWAPIVLEAVKDCGADL